MRKHSTLIMLSLMGLLTFASPAMTANAAWKNTSNGKIYTQSGTPGYVTGWKKIKKYIYYFDKNGIMQTGFQTIDKKIYYFNKKGRLVYGLIRLDDGKVYYASDDGSLITEQWVGNYYYQEDGSMATNAWINGKWVGADGKYTGIQSNIGWITRGGKTYYYDYSQRMVTGWLTLKGKTYYLQSTTGELLKGWITVSGRTYYADPKTGAIQKSIWVGKKYIMSNGNLAIGIKKIGNRTYLFDSNGDRQSGWTEYNGNVYYLTKKRGYMRFSRWIGNRYVTPSGARASGFYTIDGKTYYFDPETGLKHTGWVTVGEDHYYLTKSKGIVYKNRWLLSKKYYAGSSGAVYRGLHTIKGQLYYFDSTTGIKLRNSKKKVNGYTYYFQNNGTALKSQWIKLGKYYYYFKNTGKMAVSTWIDGYYVNAKGHRSKKQATSAGWTEISGVKYYFYPDGKMATGWTTIEGKKYYFSSTGAMLTGIQKIGTHKYYFLSSGQISSATNIILGSKQYVINDKGMVTSEKSLKITENSLGDRIVNFALNYVGNKYVYGGTSLTNGADCSGFVQSVFANFGIKLLRVADDQMRGPDASLVAQGYKAATIVYSADSMRPGDLVFYGSSDTTTGSLYASHVAIYIGNGNIVHASNSQPYPAGGIKISPYNYQTPIRIVRYWN